MNTSGIRRRTFVRTGVAGLAGAAIAPILSAQPHEVDTGGDEQAGEFIYRTLGKTGIRLPIVSIGAVSFDAGLYGRALDSGVRHVDTAPSYRNGNHERMLGQVFGARGRT